MRLIINTSKLRQSEIPIEYFNLNASALHNTTLTLKRFHKGRGFGSIWLLPDILISLTRIKGSHRQTFIFLALCLQKPPALVTAIFVTLVHSPSCTHDAGHSWVSLEDKFGLSFLKRFLPGCNDVSNSRMEKSEKPLGSDTERVLIQMILSCNLRNWPQRNWNDLLWISRTTPKGHPYDRNRLS